LHLLHPALVHFTIAFLVVGPLLESWGVLARREAAARAGSGLTIAGMAVLVPTIVAGYLAANALTVEGEAHAALDRHESFGLMLLGVCLALALARAWMRGKIEGGARVPYAIGLWVVVALAGTTALLGGRLVYGLGVGVGR
jgi:uncharacterized membrane protein